VKYNIFETIKNNGNYEAIKFGEKIITYDKLLFDIEESVNHFTKLGITSVSHVAVKIKNPVSYINVFLALWKINATIVPLDLQVSENNINELLEETDVAYLITDSQNLCSENLLESVSFLSGIIYYTDKINNFLTSNKAIADNTWIQNKNLPNLGYIILFTSGTSGKSKGVLIEKDAFVNNVMKVIEYTGLSYKDSILLTLPLTYCFALSQFLAHLLVGGKIVLYEGLRNCLGIFLKAAESKVTNLSATPYFYDTLVKEKINNAYKINQLKFFMNAGGYISKHTIKEMFELFPNVIFFNNYGQTEASPRLTYNKMINSNCKLSSVGKPLKGVKIKIEKQDGEIGEILYNSEDMMVSYYKSEPISRDLFIHSGDLGFIDNSGDLTILGRKDSMIKINGRKVYKNKIEDELNKLTFVKMIKLKKTVHHKFGEYFVAHVVINDDYCKNTAVSKLQEYCKKNFDKYIIPKKFIILENMKLNSNQKVVLEESK
jgi:long-chain acyl-CoA synthetase